jgi:hypothetical protein
MTDTMSTNAENQAPDPSGEQQQTTAAQPQPSAPSLASVASIAQSAAAGLNGLVCQWQNCGERCATAEQLYVGAKVLLL